MSTMEIVNLILNKQEELDSLLSQVNVEELKSIYSRQELNEIHEKLSSYKRCQFSSRILTVMEEMKKEEYPELLGVHHFPVLKEIDFLTEKQKIALDEHLLHFRVGEYLAQLRRVAGYQLENQIKAFLVQKGVAEEQFLLKCPYCNNGHLTNFLTKTQMDLIINELSNASKAEDLEHLLDMVDLYCSECDEHVEMDKLIQCTREARLPITAHYKMIQERDSTLDFV